MVSQQPTQQQAGTQWNPPRKSIILRVIRSLERSYRRYASKGQQQQTPEYIMAVWTRRLGKLTFVLAIAAIGSLVVIFYQLVTMEGQLQEMKSSSGQTDRAITVSNKIAEAAIEANRLRENADRAYIFAAPGSMYHVSPGHIPQVYIGIGNSGHTIGRNVIRTAGIRLMRYPGTDSRRSLASITSAEEGIPVIGPRVDQVVIRELPDRHQLTSEEVQEIRTGKSRLYVFGLISYDDMFGHQHSTEFCFMYFGHEYAPWEAERGGPGYFSNQAKYCKEHNYAD